MVPKFLMPVLLDAAGHAHITDFNIAVRFKPDKPLMSVAGSMAYMAPEVLQKQDIHAKWTGGV